MDWRKSIYQELRRRNRRETGFADLIKRHGGGDLQGGGGGGGGFVGVRDEDSISVKSLEQKLFRVQEELTELHRKKGDNAQRVIDLSTALQYSQKEIQEKEKSLVENESLVLKLQQEIESLNEKLDELRDRNQLLNDEYQALHLALNSADHKLIEAQKENDRLLAQVMEFKERDVQLMNRENEIFLQKVQLQVQQQLREAAEEKTVHLPNEKNIQTVGQANLSTICATVRLPTKSYLKFIAHDGEVNCVAWNPHTSDLYTGGSDRKIKYWNIAKGVAENRGQLSGCNGSIMSLDFDTSGSLILGASGDFASRIWSVDGCRLRHTLTGHSGKVMSAKFLLDSTKFISGSQDRTIKVWDLQSRACISTKFAGSTCNDLVTNETMIISGHFDKKIRFYDCRNIGGSSSFGSDTHQSEIIVGGKITSLDLSKNGQYLLASTRENKIEITDLRNMKTTLNCLSGSGFQIGCDWARATFSPDSEYVACGTSDGSIFIWKYNSSNPERILKEFDSVVVAVAWQPSGNGLVSCDKNRNVVVWADI
ncbi:LOW QUALITY PROTEIN: autophagy-related protein 16-1-like [Lepeophtheirus salmonis]|uniref:LOW QUALITY PROTEIN: autophagy-related protein 16-1-like n=1 Tax=Lepeophtheirus salmonis TaxID=72036 RepID=UPI001AEA1BB9|nr:LOW QUALITY PROTEIN: autophagy-related protein 16-1-like [Lepeophtheirus salmonis]